MGFEYYSALKMKEILTHGTTWTNLEDILLNERNQSQKDKYCMFPLYKIPKAVKYIETESRWVIAKGWRKRDGELMFIWYKVTVGKMKKFWRWLMVMVAHNLNVLNAPEWYILKWLKW